MQEEDLSKSAITSGGFVQDVKVPQAMSGSETFQLYDISDILETVVTEDQDYILFNKMTQVKVTSPTPFLDIKNAIGSGTRTSRSTEYAAIKADRGQYHRAVFHVKRYLSRGEISYESIVYDQRYKGLKFEEMKNCASRILLDVERDLNLGNSYLVKEGNAAAGGGVMNGSVDTRDLPAMDGIEAQIRKRLHDENFLPQDIIGWEVDEPVQDLQDTALVLPNIQEAVTTAVNRLGKPNALILTPAALANLNMTIYDTKQLNVMGLGNQIPGFDTSSVRLSNGRKIELIESRFMGQTKLVANISEDKPVVSGGSVTGSEVQDKGTTAKVGSVWYKVCAVNDDSESEPMASEEVKITKEGSAVDLTIAYTSISESEEGGKAQVFHVYRATKADGPFFLVGKVLNTGRSVVFCDRNLRLENTSTAVMAEITPKAMCLGVSIPLSYRQLAVFNKIGENWAQFMNLTFMLRKVTGCALFDNVANKKQF